MDRQQLEDLEIELMLEAIVRRYGYDFRQYAPASIRRRVLQARAKYGCTTISELTSLLLHHPDFFQQLVSNFSITVTEMFRDPEVYQFIRREIIPYLATYPFIKIWHAGCATGEEAYSMAIILAEAGLLEKTTIYATDFNEAALKSAKEGIYSLEKIKAYTENYRKSGGGGSFSSYFHADYGSAIIQSRLRAQITFARHNLVQDQVFGEMHFIFCRNVLMYFKRALQDKVLKIFDDSLIHNGFLCLGNKESLRFSSLDKRYLSLDDKKKIYRKKGVID